MHPAKSVIFFTTASGAGYGLIVWLAVAGSLGLLPAERAFGFVAFGLAFVLIVSGLLSSTFHLGHPERAWRALSQWRTSWLSREGVAAIVSFAPMGLYALLWTFFGENAGPVGVLGALSAAAAVITVYCTSMIYASLRTIPAWSNSWTPISYIVLSVSTGGVLAAFLARAWSYPSAPRLALAALVAVIAGLVVKALYWRKIASAPARSTAESATGLGRFGSVRLIDAPHTQSNYLLEEMGFQIARKHASKLRRIVIIAGFATPALLLAVALYFSSIALFAIGLAILLGAVGIVAERWLFFAEAKHAVTLYYGQGKI